MKITEKQLHALKYAADLSEEFPTYSVARRLEVKGLLHWSGTLRGPDFFSLGGPGCRGWRLTEQGRRVLNETMKGDT